MTQLAIVIPTYKRAHLLKLLLQDILAQSTQPDFIVIVDGDHKSGDVPNMLRADATGILAATIAILYVASNHSNLAYQRYLGWRVARQERSKILLYLDDDLRISDADSISRLIEPLGNDNWRDPVVGCTGSILYPENRETSADAAVQDRARIGKSQTPLVVKLFGSSRGMPPGSLSPSGHRRTPAVSDSGVAEVQWLRGGVMGCRMDSLTEDCFSEDLFALSELGYGHGEDTHLSRRLASKGRLQFISDSRFLHPCSDAPKAYATRAGKMGYGTAYSRRLLNDNYRWPAPPKLGDRFALWKSYAATTALNLFRSLRSPAPHRFAYAWGYFCGALNGVFLPPSHQRLTPLIDWRNDAEAALRNRVDLPVSRDIFSKAP